MTSVVTGSKVVEAPLARLTWLKVATVVPFSCKVRVVPLNDALLKGDFEARPHPSGGTLFISKDYPEIPQSVLRRVAARARELLAAG